MRDLPTMVLIKHHFYSKNAQQWFSGSGSLEGAGTPHMNQSLVPPGFPPRCREPGPLPQIPQLCRAREACASLLPEGRPHPRAWGAGAAGSWTPTAQPWEWGPDATLQGKRPAALLVHPPWARIGAAPPRRPWASLLFGDVFCSQHPPSPILLLFCPWPPRRKQRHSSGLPWEDHKSGQPALWALPWKHFDEPCSADLPPSEPPAGSWYPQRCLPWKGAVRSPEATPFWLRDLDKEQLLQASVS